jgi:hypothetical protein
VARLGGCIGAGCPLCLPEPLPQDATGQTLCRIFLALPAAGDSCAAHGLTAASADNVAAVDSVPGQPPPGAICVLPQLPAENQANQSCTTSSAAGWCYLTGAAAGHCAERIDVSPTAVPQGAGAYLGCGQTAGSSPPSASATSVGIACIPSEERSPTFAGFHPKEVTLDEGNSACASDVCLVNHFEGLTSCPYGQDSTGAAPPGAQPCALPDAGAAVHPDGGVYGQSVGAWCTDRKPSSAVYCSCRCQNALGKTDDGASYCSCPTGFTCSQVVPAIEPGDPRAGGYCIRTGSQYSPNSACSNTCYPGATPCP